MSVFLFSYFLISLRSNDYCFAIFSFTHFLISLRSNDYCFAIFSQNRVQRYEKFCIYARKFEKFSVKSQKSKVKSMFLLGCSWLNNVLIT